MPIFLFFPQTQRNSGYAIRASVLALWSRAPVALPVGRAKAQAWLSWHLCSSTSCILGHLRRLPGAGNTLQHVWSLGRTFFEGCLCHLPGHLTSVRLNWRTQVGERANWDIEKRDRKSIRRTVKEIWLLNYRNTSQNRELHLVQWNFRSFELM